MGSKGLVWARCTWLSALLPCVLLFLPSMVKSQFLDCSIQGVVGLDLEPCLNHQGKSSMDSCCQSLNKMVKAGYHCLCLLLSSSTSQFLSPSFPLPFANCYISVPSLVQCPGNSKVPALGVLPPIIDGREPVKPPSSTATIFMPPPLQLPNGMQKSMNLTQGKNLTWVGKEEPHSNDNCALNLTMPDNNGVNVRSYAYNGECRKQAKIWTYPRVVLVVVTLLRTGFL